MYDLRPSASICGSLFLLVGCVPKGNWVEKPRPYFGPTESMVDVVAAIDKNNLPIRTLWARHHFEATVVDERGESHFVNGDGNLLFRKPRELRLIGNKDIAGTIFEAGSTSDRFWLKVLPELDTMWWGYHANVGKPCGRDVPIRPDALVEVLAVSDFDADFSTDPQPVMRFNNDSDAYMFLWTRGDGGRRIPVREVWYDRATKLPRLVLFFDAEGRIVVRAYLSNHLPLPVEGVSEPDRPKVATDFRIFFPQSGTKLNLQLRDLLPTRNGVPNDKSIRFPGTDDVRDVIQIDRNCGGE